MLKIRCGSFRPASTKLMGMFAVKPNFAKEPEERSSCPVRENLAAIDRKVALARLVSEAKSAENSSHTASEMAHAFVWVTLLAWA